MTPLKESDVAAEIIAAFVAGEEIPAYEGVVFEK